MTVWAHKDSGEISWQKPAPPLCPLLPASLVCTETGKRLSPRTIRQNEADSSTEDSFSSDDDSTESLDVTSSKTESLLLSEDAEYELAAKRV